MRNQSLHLCCLLAGAALHAHDMWIEPGTFVPQPGQIVGVRLRVGENLVGDPIPRDPRLIREFFVTGGSTSERIALGGRPGGDPAGMYRAPSTPGSPQLIGYYSNPSAVELPAEKFNEYLEQEGLDTVLALRAARKQVSAPAKERFTRCAKSLLGPGAADRELGFPLELIAERPPSQWLQAGDTLPVRLQYLGKPLQGALVVAIHRMHPAQKLTGRTDRAGRVRFQMPAAVNDPGMWMIKAVHMVPDGATEWSSYWASLTFENAGPRK